MLVTVGVILVAAAQALAKPNEHSELARRPPPGGPNVCGTSVRACCPGWTQKSTNGLCIVPICVRDCGEGGRCVRPNLCICSTGAISPVCNGSDRNLRFGGRVRNGGGRNGETAVCREPCLNGGRCVGLDRCACVYGFTGRRCEVDYRTGPCFTEVQHDMCQGQLPGVVSTKQLCCAIIGKAWGHPCEQCPERLDCDKGFLKNMHSGECVDIDECEAIPGLCEGGVCVNSYGSFTCECPEGQVRNPESNTCEDRDECEDEDTCLNGRCVNTDGSYYCSCDTGYMPSQDRKRCLDTRKGFCYTEIPGSGRCKKPVPTSLTQQACCCGENMGKAWGEDHNDCTPCPMVGEEKYQRMCEQAGYQHPLMDNCTLNAEACGEGGRCVDTDDGFTCECYDGFTLNSAGDLCEDHDECSETGLCANGNCTNMDGSFKCVCNDGYVLSPSGFTCIDLDECQSGPCKNGRCINTEGSFRCECSPGFTLGVSGLTCLDTKSNSCYGVFRDGQCSNQSTTPTTKSACCCSTVILGQPMGWGTPCQSCPQPGTHEFLSLCPHGPGITHEGHDIDECALSLPICRNGACENLEGGYRCICNTGYTVDESGRQCHDINECAIDNLLCDWGQVVLHRLRLGHCTYEKLRCDHCGDMALHLLVHYLSACPATARLRQQHEDGLQDDDWTTAALVLRQALRDLPQLSDLPRLLEGVHVVPPPR